MCCLAVYPLFLLLLPSLPTPPFCLVLSFSSSLLMFLMFLSPSPLLRPAALPPLFSLSLFSLDRAASLAKLPAKSLFKFNEDVITTRKVGRSLSHRRKEGKKGGKEGGNNDFEGVGGGGQADWREQGRVDGRTEGTFPHSRSHFPFPYVSRCTPAFYNTLKS